MLAVSAGVVGFQRESQMKDLVLNRVVLEHGVVGKILLPVAEAQTTVRQPRGSQNKISLAPVRPANSVGPGALKKVLERVVQSRQPCAPGGLLMTDPELHTPEIPTRCGSQQNRDGD